SKPCALKREEGGRVGAKRRGLTRVGRGAISLAYARKIAGRKNEDTQPTVSPRTPDHGCFVQARTSDCCRGSRTDAGGTALFDGAGTAPRPGREGARAARRGQLALRLHSRGFSRCRSTIGSAASDRHIFRGLDGKSGCGVAWRRGFEDYSRRIGTAPIL